MYVSTSKEIASEFSKAFLDGMRAQFSYREISYRKFFNLYLYLITFRYKYWRDYLTQMLFRMDFPITSAEASRKIVQGLAANGICSAGIADILDAKIDRMAAIEQNDRNFLRSEFVAEILPGENFERT